MANLTYKTRGMSSPQGKQKVYFTCHPTDSALYFESVTDEILRYQNCAIWYDDEPLALYDRAEYENLLSTMNLIVIPVTSRFLYQPNRALEVDFSYAIEHHIPVLPLLQDSELAAPFNKICGDLQYLDPHNQDDTQISYQEKFQNYLESVLVGDELAKKIRDAFDAYIFLSYRKKDRAYAQTLMRLIHQNPFCRDIAIWYDEFLTPGENFNQSIGAALEKSDLFTMVVTPNLVNEPNYVMTTEYPLAQRHGKETLPVMMVPVDQEILQQKFESCPPSVKVEDAAGFSQHLLDLVRKLGIEEQNTSPEHRFFIGLAYLGGIDVEIDNEKALELIKGAAEEGLTEAAVKLVSMYRNGNGVKRNYYAAIHWQEKIVAQCRQHYRDNSEENALNHLLMELYHLFLRYEEMREYTKAMPVIQEAVDLCQEHRTTSDAYAWNHCYSLMLDSLGHLYFSTGQYQESEKTLKQSITLAELNIWDKASLLPRRTLGKKYSRIAFLYAECRKHDLALEYYKKCADLRQELALETGETSDREDLVTTYNNMGTLYLSQLKYLEAEHCFADTMLLGVQLIKETDSLRAKELLAVAYNNMAVVSKGQKKSTLSKEYYSKSLALRQELAELTESIASRESLALCYSNLGILYYENGSPRESLTHHQKAMELYSSLTQETDSPKNREHLAMAFVGIAHALQLLNENDDSAAHFKKAISLLETLHQETEIVSVKEALSSACNAFGKLCQDTGNLSNAFTFYEKGCSLRESLARENNTLNAWISLANSYNNLGYLYLTSHREKEGVTYYEKNISLLEPLQKQTNELEVCQLLSYAYFNLGYVHKDKEEYKTAILFFEKAATLRENMATRLQTAGAKNELAAAYIQLSEIYEAMGKNLKTLKYIKLAKKYLTET